jgi:hypothetical protein
MDLNVSQVQCSKFNELNASRSIAVENTPPWVGEMICVPDLVEFEVLQMEQRMLLAPRL